MTEPGSSTPPETHVPCIDELEHKVSFLYTYSGTSDEYRVFACNHCAPGEVLTSEGLLEDMQRKIEVMAERGHKAVQSRIEALQELGLAKKQHAQVLKTMANNAKQFKAAEEDLLQQVAKAEKAKDTAEQTVVSSAAQKFKAAESDLRQEVLKAEKVQTLAEQVNADMLMQWNTALWEVATLEANVQQLERQIERETKAKTTAEDSVAALQEQLSTSEDTSDALTQELSNAQDLLFVTRRHLQTQTQCEVDARTTAERESETLLIRIREAAAQSKLLGLQRPLGGGDSRPGFRQRWATRGVCRASGSED